jgi:hypothetical protein
MAKSAKKLDGAKPSLPQVGDKVLPPRSEMVYEIMRVHFGRDEVDLHVPGTNLERYRVRTDALRYVERMPPVQTSNPFTKAEPVFDTGDVLDRIAIVQQESLKQFDGDMDLLKAYLKTQKVPKAAITVLESLTVEHHVGWKKAMEKIEKLLSEE